MGAIKTQHLPNYSIKDYRLWEGNWQLIQGVPFSMSPSPTRAHQKMAKDLLIWLNLMLDRSPSCKCEVLYELDLLVDNHTVVRPDLMVLCGPHAEDYPDQAPSLIVEVLSKSTEQMDRQIKMGIYQRFGVSHYWLADPASGLLECLELQETYQLVAQPDQINLDECVVDLDWSLLDIVSS